MYNQEKGTNVSYRLSVLQQILHGRGQGKKILIKTENVKIVKNIRIILMLHKPFPVNRLVIIASIFFAPTDVVFVVFANVFVFYNFHSIQDFIFVAKGAVSATCTKGTRGISMSGPISWNDCIPHCIPNRRSKAPYYLSHLLTKKQNS